MKVQCAVEGCASVYASDETAAPNVKYVCSHHTRKEQMAVVGRTYNAAVDNKDQETRFQERSFDKQLDGKKSKANRGYTHPLPERPALYQSTLGEDVPCDLIEAAIADDQLGSL